jgi:hypothetical protein
LLFLCFIKAEKLAGAVVRDLNGQKKIQICPHTIPTVNYEPNLLDKTAGKLAFFLLVFHLNIECNIEASELLFYFYSQKRCGFGEGLSNGDQI